MRRPSYRRRPRRRPTQVRRLSWRRASVVRRHSWRRRPRRRTTRVRRLSWRRASVVRRLSWRRASSGATPFQASPQCLNQTVPAIGATTRMSSHHAWTRMSQPQGRRQECRRTALGQECPSHFGYCAWTIVPKPQGRRQECRRTTLGLQGRRQECRHTTLGLQGRRQECRRTTLGQECPSHLDVVLGQDCPSHRGDATLGDTPPFFPHAGT